MHLAHVCTQYITYLICGLERASSLCSLGQVGRWLCIYVYICLCIFGDTQRLLCPCSWTSLVTKHGTKSDRHSLSLPLGKQYSNNNPSPTPSKHTHTHTHIPRILIFMFTHTHPKPLKAMSLPQNMSTMPKRMFVEVSK